MKNTSSNNKQKTTDLEQDSTTNPQLTTQRFCDSTTTHLSSEKLPGIGNLNQSPVLNKEFPGAKNNPNGSSAPVIFFICAIKTGSEKLVQLKKLPGS